ncbi:MAG: ubiquinol-cytochrome c reductase iron-sulfur subunit [Gammaproteobacteria bacterium]|jgi:ubiquinol-cytochrome c reductase iron-sulfur subunit
MSDDSVDKGKRRFLVQLTSATAAVGAVGWVIPVIDSMNPSARAQAAGAPVEADFSKLEPGEMMTVVWRKKPVWILRRTDKNLSDLPKLDSRLTDPKSEVPHQPAYCKNEYRSYENHKHIWVAIGICTHLGCSPTYRPDVAPPDLGPKWVGGYFCPCHGSRFDLAGRVFNGSPAPTNLVIPPYRYVKDDVIVIGENPKKGAA